MLATFKRISSEQGYRVHPISGKREGHGGMDLSANSGTKVRVMADGEIVKVGWDRKVKNGKVRGYGRYIVVQHKNGHYTLYAHLEKDGTTVNVGEKVSDGDVIGTSGNTGGSTGPHLHLEVIKADNLAGVFKWKNKINPRDVGDLQEYLNGGSDGEGDVENTVAASVITENGIEFFNGSNTFELIHKQIEYKQYLLDRQSNSYLTERSNNSVPMEKMESKPAKPITK